LTEKCDLVIASCGGFPKDINLIQAHKSMEYAIQALKDGGVLILLAECRDGFGNASFFNWFRYKWLNEFETALRKQYEINGQTAFSLLQKALRFRIILVSLLPDHQVEEMGMIASPSLEDAIDQAVGMLPAEWRYFLIPEAGSILPVMATEDTAKNRIN
jgi:nickel-dependent lactate racemase